MPRPSASLGARLAVAVGLFAAIGSIALGVWLLARRAERPHTPRIDVAPEAFTIVVLGGSVAMGEPYAPRAEFGSIVRWLLGGKVGGREIRVVNLGGAGKASPAVLEDARTIAAEPAAPGAGVALLYIGNNEFLELDVVHDLSNSERALFDRPTLPPELRERVFQRFEENLDATIAALQSAGFPIVASTIAVNAKDWEPNRSVLRDPLHAEPVAIDLDDAERAIERGDDAAALDSLRRVLRVEPGFAWAWFRSGECLRRLGRNAEAREHFAHAVDEDGNPYRETSEQTRILRETCARRGVDLIDAVAILEGASADGMIGFDSMWDNCHPTLAGYLHIADRYADRIVERFGATKVHAATEVDALRAALGIGDADDIRVLGTRGQYCYVASTLIWNPAARLARARLYLDEASGRAPLDPNLACSDAILEAMCGNADASRTAWKRAFSIDPDGTRTRTNHTHVRQLLGRIGVTDPESMFAD